ncbi:MAG: NfeD family protein [Actinomycetales bacterium]
MSWISENAALAWLAAALVLGVLEVLTLDLFFVMLAGGALAGALASALNAPIAVSVGVAVVVALLLVVALRPMLLRSLRSSQARPSGTAALVGRTAEVIETVDDRSGLVKLAGETWTARVADDGVLPAGTQAVVVRIDGATAVVEGAPNQAPTRHPYGP